MSTPRSRIAAPFALSFCLLAASACNSVPPKKRDRDAGLSRALVVPLANSARASARYEFQASGESTIEFVAVDAEGKHAGAFRAFRGTVLVEDGSARRASVSVDIELDSLQMDDAKLGAALKSNRFLNVHGFPQARFVSTSIERGGEQGATDTVKGNLEMHGVTRPIAIPSTIHLRPSGVYLDAQFTLSRGAFELGLPGDHDRGVRDEVVVSLLIAATRVDEPAPLR